MTWTCQLGAVLGAARARIATGHEPEDEHAAIHADAHRLHQPDPADCAHRRIHQNHHTPADETAGPHARTQARAGLRRIHHGARTRQGVPRAPARPRDREPPARHRVRRHQGRGGAQAQRKDSRAPARRTARLHEAAHRGRMVRPLAERHLQTPPQTPHLGHVRVRHRTQRQARHRRRQARRAQARALPPHGTLRHGGAGQKLRHRGQRVAHPAQGSGGRRIGGRHRTQPRRQGHRAPAWR